MKLGKIATYIGAGLLAVSCSVKKPASEKALAHASNYLKGTEIVMAEKKAWNIPSLDNMNYSHDIFYWDSLLSVNREKEFFKKGQQYANDSINGKQANRPEFSVTQIEPEAKTNSYHHTIDSIKLEVAKYYSGRDFLNLEQRAPHNSFGAKWGTNENARTHYYGLLSIKGAERKGFEDGVASVINPK